MGHKHFVRYAETTTVRYAKEFLNLFQDNKDEVINLMVTGDKIMVLYCDPLNSFCKGNNCLRLQKIILMDIVEPNSATKSACYASLLHNLNAVVKENVLENFPM